MTSRAYLLEIQASEIINNYILYVCACMCACVHVCVCVCVCVFDPWTIQGLGTPTLHAVENLHITVKSVLHIYASSIVTVLHLQIQPTTDQVIFTIRKNPHIKWTQAVETNAIKDHPYILQIPVKWNWTYFRLY